MSKFFIKIFVLLTMIVFLTNVQGCTGGYASTENGQYIDFTVIRDDDIPEKLREQIEESKEKVFKITYKDDEYL